MKEYKLVNPFIAGTFVDTYKAKSVTNAAHDFWNQLAGGKYITGSVPVFYFSLMNTENNDLFHFKVKEKRTGSEVNFSIDQLKEGIKNEDLFIKKYNDVKSTLNINNNTSESEMSGGKRKRYDDSSSSDSDSDEDLDDFFRYIRSKQTIRPIVYWWYTPSLYNIETVFTPTFVAPIAPPIQLYLI